MHSVLKLEFIRAVLSPFLFAVVMDVVCGDVMVGLLFEIYLCRRFSFDGRKHERIAVKVEKRD